MTNNIRYIQKILIRAAAGFTLIETLVAVLLLTSAIAGPLTLASKGLSSSLVAKDQVGAFFLAQDAVEYVRFKRDSNKLAAAPWLTGLVGSGLCSADGSTSCKIDSMQDTVAACGATCTALNYDSVNHFFSYTTGSLSAQRYVRTVTITTPVGSNASEASLVVKVSWTGAGGLQHAVTVRENLYDW